MSDIDTNTPTKSDPPQSRGKHFVEQLNAYRNIILATAALATAVGSWLKPTDTSATKQSFDWTTKKVEELSKNDVQMHDDIVALRAYLEGMKAVTPTVATVNTVHPETVAATKIPPTRSTRRSGGIRMGQMSPTGDPMDRLVQMDHVSEQMLEEGPPQQMRLPLPLPSLKSEPHQMERPSFEDITLE